MVYIERLALILLLLSAVYLGAEPVSQSFELTEEQIELPLLEPVSAEEDSLDLLIPDETVDQAEEITEDILAGITKADVIAYIDILREVDFPDASLFDPNNYPDISFTYRFGSDYHKNKP